MKTLLKLQFKIAALAICLLLANNVLAQSQEIKGVVKDSEGVPLIGASVIIKGTSNGAITTQAGEFILNANVRTTLVVSYVGHNTLEVNANSSYLTITLTPNAIGLDKLVVIGYGSVKKSDMTGSVTSVDMESIQVIPANSVERLLQGRVAGLRVVNSSQDPGEGATVQIRGGSSLRGSNSPLLVVDGFPMGDAGNLKQINPSDIASMEVLKDASAAAIYGSRGANGVIIVTTNQGKKGTFSVNVNQQTSVGRFSSKLNIWRDPALMATLSNEGRVNGDLKPLYIGAVEPSSGIYYPSVAEIESGQWKHNTRWDDVVFRTPITSSTSVSINGSNDKTTYRIGYNHFEDKGVYIKDDYSKNIINLDVKHELHNSFSIRTNSIISRSYRDNNGGLAYWRNSLWPEYNEDGSYFLAGDKDYSHPLALTNHVVNRGKGTDFISSMLADWQILPYLDLKSQVSYKYGVSKTNSYSPKKYTETGVFNDGAANMKDWVGENVVSETFLTFNKTFGKGKLNAMVGHSYEEYQEESMEMNSYDFVNESLGNENMGAGDPEKNRHWNEFRKSKLLSFYGRLNYSFDDKYILTATMRADGSSKFGKNNKWAYFPSGAFAWKMHNEKFIKDLNIFNELKLRMSYGISGNQGISAYQTLSRYGVEEYYYNGKWNTAIGPGYVVGNEGDSGRFAIWGGIPNTSLKWETTAQWDLGLDFGILNNRLRVNLDLYNKRTTDLLRERLIPISSGYNKMWVNDGEVTNKGFEVSVNGDIISGKDFSLFGTVIYSMNRNKVVDLGDPVASGLNTDHITGMKYEFWGSSLENFRQSPNILAVGKPVNVFYGYKVDGIIQTAEAGALAGLTGALAQPGEFKYVDADENGTVDLDGNDRVIIGNPNPDFTASLSLGARYKNFDFEIFLNGVYGNDILYQNMWGGQANTSPLRWTQDNRTNDYPSLRDMRAYYLSDWYVKDGSYLRIQNINLGYTLGFKENSPIKKLRAYINATDLYTFTKFKGYDPEVGMNGIYWGGYPRLSKFTLGLELTF